MKKGRKQSPDDKQVAILESLQDLLILNFTLAGVPQNDIRALLGVDIVRVNRVAKLVNAARRRAEENRRRITVESRPETI